MIKVMCIVIENVVFIVFMFFIIECVIVDELEENVFVMGGMLGGMLGMM